MSQLSKKYSTHDHLEKLIWDKCHLDHDQLDALYRASEQYYDEDLKMRMANPDMKGGTWVSATLDCLLKTKTPEQIQTMIFLLFY